MKGVVFMTRLGIESHFLIACLSARTAREDALPTSDRRLLFMPMENALELSSQRFSEIKSHSKKSPTRHSSMIKQVRGKHAKEPSLL